MRGHVGVSTTSTPDDRAVRRRRAITANRLRMSMNASRGQRQSGCDARRDDRIHLRKVGRYALAAEPCDELGGQERAERRVEIGERRQRHGNDASAGCGELRRRRDRTCCATSGLETVEKMRVRPRRNLCIDGTRRRRRFARKQLPKRPRDRRRDARTSPGCRTSATAGKRHPSAAGPPWT